MNTLHEQILTTDLYWINKEMWWRIYMIDGRKIEVSDIEIKKWLKSVGESTDAKLSYRKFAKYANK